MRPVGISILSLVCSASAAMAAGASGSAVPPPNQTMLSVIDEDPIPSPRANGMGGAIGTVADDLDAAFHNPAGIGSLNQKIDGNAPWVRKLYFPTVTVEANNNAPNLVHDLRQSDASSNSAAGQAVVDAHADQREYARANAAMGIVLGRAMVVPFSDTQIAATPRGEGSGVVDTHYRSMNGVGYGLSVQSPDGNISLGYFGYAATRKETEGALLYDDLIDTTRRNAALKDLSETYSGTGNNLGAIWRLNYPGSPTFGLNVKNAGDTTFKAADGDRLVVKQDAQTSFSLTPHLGHIGLINIVAQLDEVGDHSEAVARKYHLGTELLLGQGTGSYAVFGLRAGYNEAGPAAGLSLHLGLVGVDFSVYYVDISADSSRVVERRQSATAFVNVAEF